MKLPKSVKIGGHKLTIKPFKKAEKDCFGYHDRDNLVIGIATDVSPSQQATSVVHEILHVCFAESGLRAKYFNLEEDVVASLEALLYSTLKNNPKIIQFIQEAE